MLEEINHLYFDWMIGLAIPDRYLRSKYGKLLASLNDTEFYYLIPLDENRYIDGINLRQRFIFENCINETDFPEFIEEQKCSMLEMMVALSLRCEEHIMGDPEIGNRMYIWFLDMIKSLQLYDMTDDNFDEYYFREIIDRFLNHDYAYNGVGGLFTISNPPQNMQETEIWYQMCWYLDSILGI